MTVLFPRDAAIRGENLTMVEEKSNSSDFMTVAFAILSKGWVFSAIGALVMVALLGTYFKTREKELLDQIASLKAMVAKDDASVTQLEKKAVAIKMEMTEKLNSQRSKFEKEKAQLVEQHKAQEKKLEWEIATLREEREEYANQVRELTTSQQEDNQKHEEELEQLKKEMEERLEKEMEERLEKEKMEMEEATEAAVAEQAATIVELQKKISALETALLHW